MSAPVQYFSGGRAPHTSCGRRHVILVQCWGWCSWAAWPDSSAPLAAFALALARLLYWTAWGVVVSCCSHCGHSGDSFNTLLQSALPQPWLCFAQTDVSDVPQSALQRGGRRRVRFAHRRSCIGPEWRLCAGAVIVAAPQQVSVAAVSDATVVVRCCSAIAIHSQVAHHAMRRQVMWR